jgi:hypothetical protein
MGVCVRGARKPRAMGTRRHHADMGKKHVAGFRWSSKPAAVSPAALPVCFYPLGEHALGAEPGHQDGLQITQSLANSSLCISPSVRINSTIYLQVSKRKTRSCGHVRLMIYSPFAPIMHHDTGDAFRVMLKRTIFLVRLLNHKCVFS